ncbi:hypothetical protein H920_07619 [Fukomys damarensis]|uniref:Uncharacterized protein n=1 Tax=Fukomys damarensis TaxID=885580 RepID=A0A091E770_FUKDA|nr:hypothetical protein H920_07619 [Fukomys damarensis]
MEEEEEKEEAEEEKEEQEEEEEENEEEEKGEKERASEEGECSPNTSLAVARAPSITEDDWKDGANKMDS